MGQNGGTPGEQSGREQRSEGRDDSGGETIGPFDRRALWLGLAIPLAFALGVGVVATGQILIDSGVGQQLLFGLEVPKTFLFRAGPLVGAFAGALVCLSTDRTGRRRVLSAAVGVALGTLVGATGSFLATAAVHPQVPPGPDEVDIFLPTFDLVAVLLGALVDAVATAIAGLATVRAGNRWAGPTVLRSPGLVDRTLAGVAFAVVLVLGGVTVLVVWLLRAVFQTGPLLAVAATSDVPVLFRILDESFVRLTGAYANVVPAPSVVAVAVGVVAGVAYAGNRRRASVSVGLGVSVGFLTVLGTLWGSKTGLYDTTYPKVDFVEGGISRPVVVDPPLRAISIHEPGVGVFWDPLAIVGSCVLFGVVAGVAALAVGSLSAQSTVPEQTRGDSRTSPTSVAVLTGGVTLAVGTGKFLWLFALHLLPEYRPGPPLGPFGRPARPPVASLDAALGWLVEYTTVPAIAISAVLGLLVVARGVDRTASTAAADPATTAASGALGAALATGVVVAAALLVQLLLGGVDVVTLLELHGEATLARLGWIGLSTAGVAYVGLALEARRDATPDEPAPTRRASERSS